MTTVQQQGARTHGPPPAAISARRRSTYGTPAALPPNDYAESRGANFGGSVAHRYHVSKHPPQQRTASGLDYSAPSSEVQRLAVSPESHQSAAIPRPIGFHGVRRCGRPEDVNRQREDQGSAAGSGLRSPRSKPPSTTASDAGYEKDISQPVSGGELGRRGDASRLQRLQDSLLSKRPQQQDPLLTVFHDSSGFKLSSVKFRARTLRTRVNVARAVVHVDGFVRLSFVADCKRVRIRAIYNRARGSWQPTRDVSLTLFGIPYCGSTRAF
jgi:hypothetical protein